MRSSILTLLLSLALLAAPAHAAISVNESYHGTLTLLTVTEIDIGVYTDSVIITNHSGTPVYMRNDGTNPSVGGDGSYVIAAGTSRVFVIGSPSAAYVKLICSVAALVSVEPYPAQAYY